ARRGSAEVSDLASKAEHDETLFRMRIIAGLILVLVSLWLGFIAFQLLNFVLLPALRAGRGAYVIAAMPGALGGRTLTGWQVHTEVVVLTLVSLLCLSSGLSLVFSKPRDK